MRKIPNKLKLVISEIHSQDPFYDWNNVIGSDISIVDLTRIKDMSVILGPGYYRGWIKIDGKGEFFFYGFKMKIIKNKEN